MRAIIIKVGIPKEEKETDEQYGLRLANLGNQLQSLLIAFLNPEWRTDMPVRAYPHMSSLDVERESLVVIPGIKFV